MRHKRTAGHSVTTPQRADLAVTDEGAGPADVSRPVYDELDAPPVALSRVGRDADGIRMFCPVKRRIPAFMDQNRAACAISVLPDTP
jgi:hypothetical protein